jgi:hypothetical protein
MMKKNKYRLHKWSIIWHREGQGGFAGQDVEVTSIALLTKWLFKLFIEYGI